MRHLYRSPLSICLSSSLIRALRASMVVAVDSSSVTFSISLFLQVRGAHEEEEEDEGVLESVLLLSPLLVEGISSLAHLENSGVILLEGIPPLRTAPRSASLSLASPWSSPAPEQGMISASVYWALPYSKVSSPSTSRSASLSAALSLILHVAKPVPVKIILRKYLSTVGLTPNSQRVDGLILHRTTSFLPIR